ncbi:hypothetical protein Hanom_Chr17g01585621 [Helianthus anomalus]
MASELPAGLKSFIHKEINKITDITKQWNHQQTETYPRKRSKTPTFIIILVKAYTYM